MMLQGEFQHKDSTGNKGLLRAGDVQWMTAGSGIIHDESPSPTFQRTGGVLEGFQVTPLTTSPQRATVGSPTPVWCVCVWT
jgi:redox-sensitive bicupin YhaK (pirin superfamily)